MICRMNKHQRNVIKQLIKAYAIDEASPFNTGEPSRSVIEAEAAFDLAFANEDEKEDDHNHVG